MHTEERTFVAIKPDGVIRGCVGEIISRFEKKGYKLIGMKMLKVTEEIAAKHYEEHRLFRKGVLLNLRFSTR